MRGHLSLFQNPIMKLTPEQQDICKMNFNAVKRRLEQTEHSFRHDALMNAVECMIIDFFDFHAKLYGADKISSQQYLLMEQFIELLERGDFRRNREISYYADKLCVTTKYLSEVSKKVSGLPAAFWITRYASLDISRLLRDRRLTWVPSRASSGSRQPDAHTCLRQCGDATAKVDFSIHVFAHYWLLVTYT